MRRLVLCYPRTTGYIAFMVTLLFIVNMIELAS